MFEDEIGSTGSWSGVPYRFDIGDLIDQDRYLVQARIGQGGMGSVLLVLDLDSRREVALKYCHSPSEYRRFAREIRAMARVEHDNVMPVLGANLEHDPPYFVMPLAERSLEDDLGTLKGDEDAALKAFLSICEGVHELHRTSIYHRDLKPANVLMIRGRILVSDLGLVRFEHRDTTILTRTIAQLGTPAYMAPEQRLPHGSQNADSRTDVYQLGKILYQLVTGAHPMLVDLKKVPPGLRHVVRRATAEDPNARYFGAEAVASAVEAYLDSKNPAANPREVLSELAAKYKSEPRGTRPAPEDLRITLDALIHASRQGAHTYLGIFHIVPREWLPLLAKGRPIEFLHILTDYASALDQKAAGMHFSFADDVAAKMIDLFNSTDDIEIQVIALRALMHAAHRLDRHAAQRIFCKYLASIQSVELALPVVEMLEMHAPPEFLGFNGMPPQGLYPRIQSFVDRFRYELEVRQEAIEARDEPYSGPLGRADDLGSSWVRI